MPTSLPGDTLPPYDTFDDCFYCHHQGVLTIFGNWRRTSGAPYADKILTYVWKKCHAPVYKPSPGKNLFANPPEMYCSDGTLEWGQVTTDCDGDYTITVPPSGTEGILGFAIIPGDWIINPDFSPCGSGTDAEWLIPNPAADWDYSCGWSTDLALSGTAVSGIPPLGSAGINLSDASAPYSLLSGGTNQITPCNVYVISTYPSEGCYNLPNPTGFSWLSVFATSGLGYEVIADPDNPGGTCGRAYSYDGSYTLDINYSVAAYVVVYGTKNGLYYPLRGVEVTVTDSCGNSTTVTTGGVGVGGWGRARLDGIDWTLIDTVTIDSGVPAGCDPAAWDTPGPATFVSGQTIYPTLDDLSHLCVSYRAPGTNVGPTLAVILTDEVECNDDPAIRLQADTYDGILVVSFVGSGDSLKTCVHQAPLSKIGNSAEGWETVTTLEASGVSDIGMVFLPNGRLYLTYDLSGAKKYRFSENLGLGSAGDWSAALTPDPSVSRHSDSGRAEGQAFRFRALSSGTPSYTGSGHIEFSQCQDNRGELWTSPATVVTGARGAYCSGEFLGNGYGCLWLREADGVIYWKTTGDGTVWGAGDGTATSLTDIPVAMARTDAGILVGLLWDATTKRTRAARSADRGLTWDADVSDIAQIPALDTPPVAVSIAHVVLAIWTLGDQCLFAASQDGGRTWQ